MHFNFKKIFLFYCLFFIFFNFNISNAKNFFVIKNKEILSEIDKFNTKNKNEIMDRVQTAIYIDEKDKNNLEICSYEAIYSVPKDSVISGSVRGVYIYTPILTTLENNKKIVTFAWNQICFYKNIDIEQVFNIFSTPEHHFSSKEFYMGICTGATLTDIERERCLTFMKFINDFIFDETKDYFIESFKFKKGKCPLGLKLQQIDHLKNDKIETSLIYKTKKELKD